MILSLPGASRFFFDTFEYRDLPTTETWDISQPLMYHGTALMHYGSMSQATRLSIQSSLAMVRSYGSKSVKLNWGGTVSLAHTT